MLQRPPGVEPGQVVVGQDQLEILSQGVDEVGFGVHPPPGRIEARRLDLADDELGIIGDVLEDQQAERGYGHASTSVRPAESQEIARTVPHAPLLSGMVTGSSPRRLGKDRSCETGRW